MSAENRTAGIAENPTAARQIALIASPENVYNSFGDVVIDGDMNPIVQFMQKVVNSTPLTSYAASNEIQGTQADLPSSQSSCWRCQPGDRTRVALVLTLYKNGGIILPDDLTGITLQPFLGNYNPGVPEVDPASFEIQAPLSVINLSASDFIQIDDTDSAMSRIIMIETFGFPWLGVAITVITSSADTISLVGYPC